MSNIVNQILNKRKIILGPSDRIKSSRLSKYSWAYNQFKDMQHNEWLASGISLVKDDYTKLNEGCQIGLIRNLAFLTNLDGIQVENLATNVVDHITDYTVKQCIYRQIYEEVNHVDAYANIIETYYEDPTIVYLLHEKNEVLREKNDYILAQANELGNEFSVEKFIYAVLSNILLEGVYFHTGFAFFYAVNRATHELSGATEMIQYIQRDETSHLYLFQNIFNVLKIEFPESFTAKVYNKIEKLVDLAVDLETSWGNHTTEKGVPGLSSYNNSLYVKHIANEKVLQPIGISNMYNVKNPYPWISEFSEIANKNDKNLFENKIQAYSKEILNWD